MILPNCIRKNFDGIPYGKILGPPLKSMGRADGSIFVFTAWLLLVYGTWKQPLEAQYVN
jgi:hypothetical protein